jgi:hypothetical protein
MGVMKMAMQKVVARMMVVTVVLLGLGLLIWSLLSPHGKVSRGDIPACQKACLSDHTKSIEKLVAQYEVARDKMEFQDQVEQAIARYHQCSDNCRVLYPIK